MSATSSTGIGSFTPRRRRSSASSSRSGVLARRVAHCARVKLMYGGVDGSTAATGPVVGRPDGGADGMVRAS